MKNLKFKIKSKIKSIILKNKNYTKIPLTIFFEEKYLTGRFFDESITGYLWAFKTIWQRNILHLAPTQPFPCNLTCTISNPHNIKFHPDDLNNFQSPGTYFQNFSANITIGKGSLIAPNVGLITANHDPCNPVQHLPGRNIIIGKNCWIGMNSVILPGVTLGDNTIVGAGSVVTKSYTEGNCIIAGSPAKKIKNLKATGDQIKINRII